MLRIIDFKKDLKPSQLEAVENLERQYESEIQELYLQLHSLIATNKTLNKQIQELNEHKEQLEADLRGKDNEIDILEWRVEYLKQFKPKERKILNIKG